MGIFDNKYPYSDFHELNLDWILETVSNLEKRVDSLKNEFFYNYYNIYYNRAAINAQRIHAGYLRLLACVICP